MIFRVKCPFCGGVFRTTEETVFSKCTLEKGVYHNEIFELNCPRCGSHVDFTAHFRFEFCMASASEASTLIAETSFISPEDDEGVVYGEWQHDEIAKKVRE